MVNTDVINNNVHQLKNVNDISSKATGFSIFNLEFLIQLSAILGNLTIILLYTVPYKDILEIYKTKDTEKFPSAILVINIVNTFFWTIYAILTNQIGLLVGNLYGLTLNCIYWITYVYCLKISSEKKLITCLFTLISIPLFFNMWLYKGISKGLTGYIALTTSSLMSVAPAQNFGKIFREKDNSYIPIRIVVIIFLSGVIWFLYGILVWDMIVILPNVWASLIGFVQIMIYIKFAKPSLTKEEDKKEEQKNLKLTKKHNDSADVVVTDDTDFNSNNKFIFTKDNISDNDLDNETDKII
jgi:uncharacterized protein with PQ loop repeat